MMSKQVAGTLGVPEIGDTISFTTEDGAVIQDVLSNVSHFESATYVRLKTIIPDGAIRQQMIQFSSCFRLEVSAEVEVFDV